MPHGLATIAIRNANLRRTQLRNGKQIRTLLSGSHAPGRVGVWA